MFTDGNAQTVHCLNLSNLPKLNLKFSLICSIGFIKYVLYFQNRQLYSKINSHLKKKYSFCFYYKNAFHAPLKKLVVCTEVWAAIHLDY